MEEFCIDGTNLCRSKLPILKMSPVIAFELFRIFIIIIVCLRLDDHSINCAEANSLHPLKQFPRAYPKIHLPPQKSCWKLLVRTLFVHTRQNRLPCLPQYFTPFREPIPGWCGSLLPSATLLIVTAGLL